ILSPSISSSTSDIFTLGLIVTELCVVMTKTEAEQAFNNFRDGMPNRVLDILPNVKEFVSGLTNKNVIERPNCGQILKHPFFANDTTEHVKHKAELCRSGQKGQYSSRFANDFTVTRMLSIRSVFSCVFEVVSKMDNCKYAVRRLAVDANGDIVKNEFRKLREMAQLGFPDIVQCYATWIEKPPEGWQIIRDERMMNDLTTKNLPSYHNYAFIYIQMQFCKYSLEEWLEKNQDLSARSLPRMKLWFKQIVSAIACIHTKNLFHGSLRPSNILFVEDDRLKVNYIGIVSEFGIDNKNGDSEIARRRRLYMSPEQRSLNPSFNAKTDIFSLGLILVELCTVIPK
ncbi:hypothetical protein PENTCL1PPCAC_8826, partial [Pristionchus entomophagus]